MPKAVSMTGEALRHGLMTMQRSWRLAPAVLLSYVAVSLAFHFQRLSSTGLSALWAGLLLLSLLTATAANGAAYRIALNPLAERPEGLGPLGLQWRNMELRIVCANLLLGLLFGFFVALAVFLVLALAAVIAYGRGHELTFNGSAAIVEELGGLGLGLVGLAVVIAAGLALILAVRLCLSEVTSAYSGKIQVLSSRVLTKGRVIELLPAVLISWSPSLVAMVLFVLVTSQESSGEPLKFAVSALSAIVPAFVQIPFSAGVFASIYQRLKAVDKADNDRLDPAVGIGSDGGVFSD
jgi:hypothetical protein